MDFFSAQDNARKNTGRLILLFTLAVVSLVIMTNFLVMIVFGLISVETAQGETRFAFSWPIFCYVGLAVLLVVAGGTWYKIKKLSGGGDAVATMLGGVPIFPDDLDFQRKRLINVVEEMAIASGTPVPQVYLLNEPTINAFAAGFSTSDAVIAVTKGAIKHLNREQLQGIVAHEFSHILNGDMRINIRLVGILHGILLIGLLGRQLLEGSHSSRKGSGTSLLLGLGLVCIGYVGTFFGNLIKAAVSRQREFLADAAAIQFTRNPDGIGAALLIIGSAENGSILRHPKSPELSHAFFCQGVKFGFSTLFATHPPLSERIKRILPGWDGIFPPPGQVTAAEASHLAVDAGAILPDPAVAGFTAHHASAAAMTPGDFTSAAGSALLYSIPDSFRKAVKSPFGCRAVICYLVLSEREDIRQQQLSSLKTEGDRGIHAETQHLLRTRHELERKHILPLLELALPGLRQLSREQCRHFLQDLDRLIQEDGRVSLLEWCIRTIVVNYMREYFGTKTMSTTGRSLKGSRRQLEVVLSTLALTTAPREMTRAEVFSKGTAVLGEEGLQLLPRQALGLQQLEKAVTVLRQLKPLAKARLFAACREIAFADKEFSVVEAELLRALAGALAIPVAPAHSGATEST